VSAALAHAHFTTFRAHRNFRWHSYPTIRG
jgi:hypothetical protein